MELPQDYKYFETRMDKVWKALKKRIKHRIYDVEMVGGVKQDDESLLGAGIMDWLKNKYNAFVQPQPQPQPQPQLQPQTNVIQPANQPQSNATKHG